jgi:hypothetical protein
MAQEDLERRIVAAAGGEEERAALRCLPRRRDEGRSLEEIAAGQRAETGLELPPPAVDRVPRRVAGPVPRREGSDPACFSGHLGGG